VISAKRFCENEASKLLWEASQMDIKTLSFVIENSQSLRKEQGTQFGRSHGGTKLYEHLTICPRVSSGGNGVGPDNPFHAASSTDAKSNFEASAPKPKLTVGKEEVP
jgi:hypothetical protein